MRTAVMEELVKTLRCCTPVANLHRMIREHTPDRSGHCHRCHTLGCTLYAAAISAVNPIR